MKYLTILFVICLAFTSCVHVAFEQPQPKGKKDLDAFPETYQGKYLIDKDSIEIQKQAYVVKEVVSKRYTDQQIDSIDNIYMRNGKLFDEGYSKDKDIPFTREGKYINYAYALPITGTVGEKLKLKKWKRKLWISQLNEKGSWDVFILSHTDSQDLILQMVSVDKEGIESLKDITTFTNKNGDYLINPGKRQLQKLLKGGLFSEGDTLRRSDK